MLGGRNIHITCTLNHPNPFFGGFRRLFSAANQSPEETLATTSGLQELPPNEESFQPATVLPSTKSVETTLNPRHRAIAEGGIPPTTYEWEREKWALGERFGEYGLTSGVDIRRLWPTVEEVEEEKALRMYRSAKDAMRLPTEAAEFEKHRKQKKLDEVQKKIADYPKMLAEFEAVQQRERTEKTQEEELLEQRVRQVQEHFGYWVDPEDPRFKLIMEEKEEDLKKAMRKTRKAEKKKLEGLVAKPSPPPVSAQPKSADEPAAADYEDE